MRFYFMLGLVLVTSDYGITAECGVDNSVKTSAAHICAFCETKSLCKNAKCDAHGFFCSTVTIGEQKLSPGSNFLKRIFTDPDCSRPNFFRLPGLVVVAVLVQNMLE